jgi:tRNA pseudouridine13 synthase|tara:strand:- start:5658 stop:6608 length:951 start_codon:yes stop_codon:yes gene_type:complete
MHAMADHRIPQYSNELLRTLQSRPTINGSIKTLHDEFLVDEILPFEPTGTGEHLYIEIEKTGANTGWVAYQLASFLDVRDLDVSYAGRKDRHGVTTQWFSCYLPSGTNVDWKLFSVEGVVVNSMTWHRSKLRRGQLQCNVFQIKVRHEKLTESQSGDLVERLEYLSEHGFPNYFGPQRFGKDGNNLILADQLLRKGERVRGNRGMLISSARSWLFNGFLAKHLELGDAQEVAQGPLIGKSRDPQPGEEYFDETEQSWAAGLRKLGAKVDTRELIVRPDQMSWSAAENALVIQFRLPPGSYATSLLRELFLVKDESV